MCGIFAYTSLQKHNNNLVFNGLKNLEYRGYDSWGIVVDTPKKLVSEKHLGKITGKVKNIPESSISIGHTRWATHGGITINNCHPHFSQDRQISLVHNGIVENYQQLKNQLKKKGYKFISQTDTEAIAHLIQNYNKKYDLKTSVRLAFLDLKGLNAIAVIKHKSNELIVVKNGSPLVVGLGNKQNFVASDINALSSLTDKFIFLQDYQMAVISPTSVKLFNALKNKVIKYKVTKISLSQTGTGLDGYPNYLSKEIHQQLDIISKISSENLGHTIDQIIKIAKTADHVFFTGCGSSYFAALFNALVVSQKINKPVLAFSASEINPYDQFLTKKSLLVVFSQSGETIDVINLVNLVKSKGVTIASVVNTPYSTLHRLADLCQILPCGPEKCVLSTKTFTAQITLFLKSLGQDLSPLIADIKNILKDEFKQNINNLAKKLSKKQHIFVISQRIFLPIGHETALKIKEVSYIHSESVSGSELKHGPIALIEKQTPCIVIAPNDEHFDDIISSATEIKARGAWIIGISPKNNSIFDDYLPIADLKTSTAISTVIISQLLAYYLSQHKGLDPDKPRNLAKSVTVK